MSLTICHPCDLGAPDKEIGPKGACCRMWLRKVDDKQVSRIEMDAGFDWTKSIKPILPGQPDWCPSSHFGYIEEGTMIIQMQDGTSKTINKGETYYIPPGHLPFFDKKTIMVEFTQDTTYTNKDFIEK